MADDPALERVIAALDASFDASLARCEDEAANDLAFSLLQGRSLADAVRSGPVEVCLSDGACATVGAVGRDYLAAGALLVPLGRALIRPADGGVAPVARRETLLEVLRGLARSGVEAEVSTLSGQFTGRLACVGEDYIELDGRSARWLVGLGSVNWVRCVLGGPEDGF